MSSLPSVFVVRETKLHCCDSPFILIAFSRVSVNLLYPRPFVCEATSGTEQESLTLGKETDDVVNLAVIGFIRICKWIKMSFEKLTRISGLSVWSLEFKKLMALYYDELVPEDDRANFENAFTDYVAENPDGCIFMYKNNVVAYFVTEKMILGAIGSPSSNEFYLYETLCTIANAADLVFKNKQPETQMDNLFLVIDETVQEGYVFESDPEVIAARALLKDDTAFRGKSEMTYGRGF